MKVPILIFGAALQPDGSPRRVLISRLQAAIAFGKQFSCPIFIPTGGNPCSGNTEATVMKSYLLQAGIAPQQIICEDQARNTIESVRYCSVILKQLKYQPKKQIITVISSAYHGPRCWWLMHLAGWRVHLAPAPTISASRSFFKRWKWRLREIPAIIWDSFRFYLKPY